MALSVFPAWKLSIASPLTINMYSIKDYEKLNGTSAIPSPSAKYSVAINKSRS